MSETIRIEVNAHTDNAPCDICGEYGDVPKVDLNIEVAVDIITIFGHKECLKKKLDEIKILIENAPSN